MSNAIRNTIVNAVATSAGTSPEHVEYDYGQHITAVVAELQEREYDLVAALIEKADEYGYATTAREILESAGLTERPAPEPVVEEPVTEQDPEAPVTRAEFTSLHSSVDKLVEAVAGLTRYIKGDSVNN